MGAVLFLRGYLARSGAISCHHNCGRRVKARDAKGMLTSNNAEGNPTREVICRRCWLCHGGEKPSFLGFLSIWLFSFSLICCPSHHEPSKFLLCPWLLLLSSLPWGLYQSPMANIMLTSRIPRLCQLHIQPTSPTISWISLLECHIITTNPILKNQNPSVCQ